MLFGLQEIKDTKLIWQSAGIIILIGIAFKDRQNTGSEQINHLFDNWFLALIWILLLLKIGGFL